MGEHVIPEDAQGVVDRLAELDNDASNLRFAATARCPCGAGLAYWTDRPTPGSVFKIPSAWDCSAILLGVADTTVQHTDQLPFAFYEVKSEDQPSAQGRTTRPAA